jgi:hypothetical protein
MLKSEYLCLPNPAAAFGLVGQSSESTQALEYAAHRFFL